MSWTHSPATPDHSRLRVLHVVNSLARGGTERVLVAFLHASEAKRADHAVCTMRSPSDLAGELPAHVPLTPLNLEGAQRLAFLRLASVVRTYRPHVIHARGVAVWADAALASIVSRTPGLILGFHGMQSAEGFTPRQRRWARALRLTRARFVSVSHAGREQLSRELGVPAERINVIPNGVDPQRFTLPGPECRNRARASFGFRPGECVIGTVASLTPIKNHAMLLSAAAGLRRDHSIRVLLVGEGPLFSELQRETRRLGINDITTFAGRREDVPDAFAAMDVYASTSLYEGMSNAMLQAMAAGLPIVATDVGDNRVVMGAGTAGQVVPTGDAERLARAISALSRDADLRRRLGDCARQRVVQHYSFDRMATRYTELYSTAGGGGQRSAQAPAEVSCSS